MTQLAIPWSKTCLQNTGYGPPPHAASVQGNIVEVTNHFTYLGSDISSCGCSTAEMFRHVGLSSSIMTQLACVQWQSRLSLCTKLRLYNALVVSVIFYGAETWTLVKSNEQKLEAFQMSCLRWILGLCWFDFVSNTSAMNQTPKENICSRISSR